MGGTQAVARAAAKTLCRMQPLRRPKPHGRLHAGAPPPTHTQHSARGGRRPAGAMPAARRVPAAWLAPPGAAWRPPACACLANSGSGSLNHTTSTSEITRLNPQSATASSTNTLAQVMRRQPSSPHFRPAAGRASVHARGGCMRMCACVCRCIEEWWCGNRRACWRRATDAARQPQLRRQQRQHEWRQQRSRQRQRSRRLAAGRTQLWDLLVDPFETGLPQGCQPLRGLHIRGCHHSIRDARPLHVLHPVERKVPLRSVGLQRRRRGGAGHVQRCGRGDGGAIGVGKSMRGTHAKWRQEGAAHRRAGEQGGGGRQNWRSSKPTTASIAVFSLACCCSSSLESSGHLAASPPPPSAAPAAVASAACCVARPLPSCGSLPPPPPPPLPPPADRAAPSRLLGSCGSALAPLHILATQVRASSAHRCCSRPMCCSHTGQLTRPAWQTRLMMHHQEACQRPGDAS